MTKRIFICADHGLAIIYFLQSEVIPSLIKAGNEVVLLTDDNLVDKVTERFGMPGLVVVSAADGTGQYHFIRHDGLVSFELGFSFFKVCSDPFPGIIGFIGLAIEFG